MVIVKKSFKRRRAGNIDNLVVMLQQLDKAFDDENRDTIKEIVSKIQSFIRTTNFSEEQTLMLHLIAQLIHCRFTTLKMKRILRKL